jgi:feruloyl-CoA synthase
MTVPQPFLPHDVRREDRPDGTIRLTSGHSLGPVARTTGDWLHQWAEAAPSRVFIAERSGAGWREHEYAETLEMVRAVAASLLERGLDGSRPIAILSGNGVDHGILSLAAQYVGIPVVPLAEQYALIPEAHDRLRYAIEKTRPAMAFAADAGRYGPALALDVLEGVERVAVATEGAPVPVTPFADLLAGRAGEAVDRAHAAVGPDTLAKILFTSGSTSSPKGVLTTHRMLCVNQTQIADALPFLRERPPRILDWLPWNHVFGGSHNFNMMLANGGSFYIDEGKPTKAGLAATLRNIRERPGTLGFNVPVGFAMLVQAFRDDADLRRAYFRELDLIFYAGASVPADVWGALEDFAREVRGAVPLMVSSWGMTETAPACVMVHEPIGRSGVIGAPLPGVEVKLIPDADMRCELRVKGPNVMKGYFEDPEKSAQAFDEEGFLVTGDAVKFADPGNPNAGLVFDGRTSEDFKLSTGTWVRAAILRLDAMKTFGRLAQDIVICGHDRSEIGVLVFPDRHALEAGGIDADEEAGALGGEAVRRAVADHLAQLNTGATSSSTRIARALVLAEPPSLKDGEVTDKGSLNVRKILTRRAALIDRLYDDSDPAVIQPPRRKP